MIKLITGFFGGNARDRKDALYLFVTDTSSRKQKKFFLDVARKANADQRHLVRKSKRQTLAV